MALKDILLLEDFLFSEEEKEIRDLMSLDPDEVEDEALFEARVKNEPPTEFIEFTKKFAKKISAKKKLKKEDELINFIDKKHKWKYEFKIDDKRNKPVAAIAAGSAISGATLGISTVVDLIVSDPKIEAYTVELENILKQSDMTEYKNIRRNRTYFYKLSKDKDYIYIAWPAVAMSTGMFTIYSIMLQCCPYDKYKGYVGLS